VTTVVIDERCTACGQCLATCPTRALIPAPGRPAVIDQRCTGCGACIEICPTDAIREVTNAVIHPIETESYRILSTRVDLSHLPPICRAVVERVIHASADLEYATTMVVPESVADAAVAAIRAGAVVITDVEMTRAAITGVAAVCYLNQIAHLGNADGNRTGGGPGPASRPPASTAGSAQSSESGTRSAAGMRLAAAQHPHGAVAVVGCAPTALDEVLALCAAGQFFPAAVIGMPVGFVGAAGAKQAARASGVPVITNVGEKGGAAVAAAACNALVRLAHG
jgi:precorrin-8X/cobalt-precorrin-8 methylmutase